MKRDISLIGAPTDIGAGARGASMGPEALRVARLQETLESHGLRVQDRGNLSGPANPWLPPQDGYRHLPEVVAWNHAVHEAVYAELQAGQLPILLGGDHCLGIGSISAVARHCRMAGRKLRVLWLDAHADFNTSVLTPSGNIHGMPVACLCGHGPAELKHIGMAAGQEGAWLNPKWVRQIGIRSVDAGEKRLVHEMGLEVFDMRYIDEMGMRHTMELALATLDDHTHLHVSFDVDFLDVFLAAGPLALLQALDAANDLDDPLQEKQRAGERNHEFERVDRQRVGGERLLANRGRFGREGPARIRQREDAGDEEDDVQDQIERRLRARTEKAVQHVTAHVAVLRQRVGARQHEQRAVQHDLHVQRPGVRLVQDVARVHLPGDQRGERDDQPGKQVSHEGRQLVDCQQDALHRSLPGEARLRLTAD